MSLYKAWLLFYPSLDQNIFEISRSVIYHLEDPEIKHPELDSLCLLLELLNEPRNQAYYFEAFGLPCTVKPKYNADYP